MLSAHGAVIEIVELANGGFEIFSDGARYGGAATRAAAEKVAQKLSAGGNTINWTKASVNVGPTPTGATGGATTGSSYSGYSTNTTVNAKGTTQTKFTTGGKEYIYEQTAAGKTAFKDAATGKYTSRPNMPPATTAQPGTNLPATTPKPGSNLPATTPKSGTNLPATTNGGGATPPPNTPNAGPASKPGLSVGSKIMGGLSVAGGAYMMYDSVKAKETKTTWGDVAEGAAGGLMATQGLVVLNAIPVAGTVAYGVAMAAGAVIGAAGAGAKMFSETDCDMDPVTGQYSCCNISKLTNIKEARLVNIGDEMFGPFPYVRTCMQGKNKFESDWWTARFLDDHWSEDGEVKFCSGWEMPADGDYNIQAYGSSEEEGKVCWQWECADPGMVRQGAQCVSDGTNPDALYNGGTLDEVVVTANAIKHGDPCPTDRLPQYATAGMYIKNGKKPDTGLDKFVCAATECKEGTYLVKNEQGVSQGWCRAGVAPVAPVPGAGDNATGAGENAGTASGTQNQVTPNTTAQPVVPVVQQTPCELGTPGWVLYNAQCITEVQMNEIIRQQKLARISSVSAKIKDSVTRLDSIKSGFKVSVWKDEDGKFNTARLASDSIAGVVLGTAGGLITSSVVKKNQIEDGFEDIQCVVGGQSVANWGDEFTVGIK